MGRGLARTPRTLAIAVAVGLAVTAQDLLRATAFPTWIARLGPAAAAFLVFLLLSRGDAGSAGLRVRPAPSVRWWLRTLAFVAVGLGVLLAAGYFVWRSVAGEIVGPALVADASLFWERAAYVCVEAPLVEESVYRLALLTPLAPWLGGWATVAVSGVVFAALHWVYGNPGLDNQVAGFVLGWAYLRSGTLWLPLLLHAAGNFGVLLLHLALVEGWIAIPGVRLV